MKRFIRAKDGKIIDFKKVWIKTVWEKYKPEEIERLNNCFIEDEQLEVVAKADTIEKLIEVGDLVKAKYKNVYGVLEEGVVEVLSMEHFSKGYINKICMIIEITELYTKQGNNYILVARKENGEWRVI